MKHVDETSLKTTDKTKAKIYIDHHSIKSE